MEFIITSNVVKQSGLFELDFSVLRSGMTQKTDISRGVPA